MMQARRCLQRVAAHALRPFPPPLLDQIKASSSITQLELVGSRGRSVNIRDCRMPNIILQSLSSQYPRLLSTSSTTEDEEAAFGDHIQWSGVTDEDIAHMFLGFYEPTGLTHLDDYEFVDKEAERKKQQRELELAKMAEISKRWVKKVDENGFSHGVGRRKESSARVWIREGEGKFYINRLPHDMYFPSLENRVEYLEPFVVTDTVGIFDTYVLVRGGGISGQASAIRHGLSRALMWYNPTQRPLLKSAGMLTRDPRVVERKKPGKAKARKSFQWVKR